MTGGKGRQPPLKHRPKSKRALDGQEPKPPSFRLRALHGSYNFLSALELQKSSALFQTEHFPLFQGASRQQRPSRQPLAPFFISVPRSKKGAGCRRKPRSPLLQAEDATWFL